MISMTKAKAKQLFQDVDTYPQNIGDSIRDPLLVLDSNLRIKAANRPFYLAFQTSPEETEGRLLNDLGSGEWNIPQLLTLLRDIVPSKTQVDNFKVTSRFDKIGERTLLLHGRKLYRQKNRTVLIVLTIEDITERARNESELLALLEHERRIASTLQRSHLFVPPEDAFPGLSVKTLYDTASDEALVGGDFWDTFVLADGKVACIIGDAMGKGLQAASFTAEVKYGLRAFLREHQEPARAFTALNRYLFETNRLNSEHATWLDEGGPTGLLCAVIDCNSGQGAVCAAGMEPPMIIRTTGEMTEVWNSGLLLGVDINSVYKATQFVLTAGDMIVMVTDGITEARHGTEFLGQEGLVSLIRKAVVAGTLTQIGASILAGARTFGDGKLRDDACILLARYTGTSERH